MLDIVLPIVVILLLLFAAYRTTIEVERMREEYISDFSTVINIALSTSTTTEGLKDRIDDMTTYINALGDKAIFIYCDELDLVNYPIPFILNLSEETLVHQTVMSHDSGRITKYIDYVRQELCFHWIYIQAVDRKYLVIFVINQHVLDFTIIQIIIHIVIFLVLAYALKTNFVDTLILSKVLQRTQKRSIDNFEYRKYTE